MKTQKYIAMMLGYRLNLSNVLTLLIILCFNFSVFSFQEKEDLFGIEKSFKSANNNQDYLVVKKQDWETFKENIVSERKIILDNQDSLSKIIEAQTDSLIRLNSIVNQGSKPINQRIQVSYFPWLLVIVLGLSLLFILYHLVRSKAKMNDANELYIEVEKRYENSKKYWIEVERQLKRELIDAKLKLEESIRKKLK
jgi:hypothetical protein